MATDPQNPPTLKEKAQAHTDAALKVFVDIMNNPEASDSNRIYAAEKVLERGHGKAKQEVETTVKVSLMDVLDSISEKEKKFQQIKQEQKQAITVEYTEVQLIEEKPKTWADLL